MKATRAKNVVFISLFAALITAGAYIRIPFGLVPFTLQSMFVIMAGLSLGGVRGSFSVLIYIAIGLLGVPVFGSGGGILYVLTPTFGYLLGFVLSAFLTGMVYRKLPNKTFFSMFIAGLVGTFSVYVIGLPYLYLISKWYLGTTIGAKVLFINCFLIFLPSDILTMVLGVFLVQRLKKHRFFREI